jgi:hypothetical protein
MKYGTEVINFPNMAPEERVDPMSRVFPRVGARFVLSKSSCVD